MSIDEEDDAYIVFASIRYAKDLVCLDLCGISRDTIFIFWRP
jgi:hypothetical protein